VSVENGHASKCVCVLEVNKDCEVHVSSFTKVVTQLRNADVKTPAEKKIVVKIYFPSTGPLTLIRCTKSRHSVRFLIISISMELSPSSEVNSCSAIQIHSILLKPKIHYHVKVSPPLDPLLSQLNPFHTSHTLFI
jgi:hypothetical protein